KGNNSHAYTRTYGDLAPGRVGNGTLEYDVPVGRSAYHAGALVVENLARDHLRVEDGNQPATYVVRMPSSYVYLNGTLAFTPALGQNGEVRVSFSDNNGLDWREIARVTDAAEQRVDLAPFVLRRYDYQLKFELRGTGTAIDALRIAHDVQHSQRALPALD